MYPAVIILYCANCFVCNLEPYDYDGSGGCKCSSFCDCAKLFPHLVTHKTGEQFRLLLCFFHSACHMWWLYSWDLDRCMNIVVTLGPLQIPSDILRILFMTFANSWTQSLPPIFHNLGPPPMLIEISSLYVICKFWGPKLSRISELSEDAFCYPMTRNDWSTSGSRAEIFF